MKNIMLIIIVLCWTVAVQAQKYQDFYLNYEVYDIQENGDWINADISVGSFLININTAEPASFMPLYIENSGNKVAFIGEIQTNPDYTGKLIDDYQHALSAKLPNTPDNLKMLQNKEGLVKVKATGNEYEHDLLFDLMRLNIELEDIYGDEILTPIFNKHSEEKSSLSYEQFTMLELAKEAHFVAGEMRGTMEAPLVEGGRFQGKNVFDAMEYADGYDVRSFIRYVKEKPFKYQGKSWKFSEIFATWIISKSPTVYDDYLDLLTDDNVKTKLRYFVDIEYDWCEEVVKDVTSEAGSHTDTGEYDKSTSLLNRAYELADYYEMAERLAWINYQRGKLLAKQDLLLEAQTEYETAWTWFKDNDDNAGIVVLGNDMGDNLNEIGGKKNWKKAVDVLEESLEMTSYFSDESSVKLIIALIHRNLGDAYTHLKKYPVALKEFKKGLALTKEVKTVKSYERMASIYFKMAEVYKLTKKKKLVNECEYKAVEAYHKSEELANNIKKL